MRRSRSAAGTIAVSGAFLAVPASSEARRPATASRPHQLGTPVINSDIARFWLAFDAINAATDRAERVRLIQTMYINPGTPGLHALMEARRYTAEQYVDSIANWPRFWASVRPLTLRSQAAVGGLNGDVARFRKLYPELTPATITYAIGVLRTGGTTVGDKVLIGAELALGDECVDVSELPEPFRTRMATFFKSRPFASNSQNNIHEYVHTQQQETRGTLLQQAVREGVAELVAEIITGKKPALPLYVYGPTHEDAIRVSFKRAMDGSSYADWLWNDASNGFGVGDLGYFVGYRIARAHYGRARDKRRALRELIQLHYDDPAAVHALVDRTGYLR